MPYEKSEVSLPEGFISLGENLSKKYESMSPMLSGMADDSEKIHYPSLYFENIKGLKNLPAEGTATIRYKKVMERTEAVKKDGETEKRYSVELCICGIKPEEDLSAESEPEEDDEDAIENGLSEAEGEMEDEETENEEEEKD